ncbi:MAG: glycosyltransferase family 2 protein [Pseudomonadota bacterium]
MRDQSEEKNSSASIVAVIPTYNEAAHIETCVRSLMAGIEATIPILIVDGMSTDGTQAIVEGMRTEFPNLTLIDNPKRLQSAALNLAAQHPLSATKSFMVRCDAHSIYPIGFIQSVGDRLMSTKAASVVTVMDAIGSTCFERANAWIVDTPLGSGGSAHRGGTKSGYVDHGHHAGFDLEWFNRIGGYDESFSHNEDAEYDRRLTEAGGKIYLDADIRIEYVPRGSLISLARQYFNYGKGRARTTVKHKAPPKLRQLLPVAAFLGCVLGLLIAPIFPLSITVPGTYTMLVVLVSAYFMAAKSSMCGIWAGLAMAGMHLSWGAGFLAQLLRIVTTNSPLSRQHTNHSTQNR